MGNWSVITTVEYANSHYTRLLSDREKTIAVYVAKEKKAIIRNDSLIDARFPEGQDLGDFFASNILTIPVKDDSTCVAVIELYRVDGVSYDEVSDGASVLSGNENLNQIKKSDNSMKEIMFTPYKGVSRRHTF